MLLGLKNQYCENGYTTKCNLQTQSNPYQIINGIFSQNQSNTFHNLYGNTKDSEKPKQSRERRMELEQESIFLCSDHTTEVAQNQRYKPMEQVRKPRDKPTYLQRLIFDKGGKNIQYGKDSIFSNGVGRTTTMCKRMKLGHFLTPYTNINSKWI